jgi:hypothetical protein
MAFKSKEELGGKIDPNINTSGRIKSAEKLTNRQLRERELLSLLRKLKPHVADSIMTAATIMKDEKASHQNQLKAAVILLDNYQKMVVELYDSDYDEEENEELQSSAPVFSLKVINGDE